MKIGRKGIVSILTTGIALLIVLMLLLKFLNLTWVEVNETGAKITINFLIPMQQVDLRDYTYLVKNESETTSLNYEMRWLSPQVAEIRCQETEIIKGKKVTLMIKEVPTQFAAIHKSEQVTIQFTTPIKLLEAQTTQLVSSTEAFKIHFNTPIKEEKIHQFISSEAIFQIQPNYIIQENGKEIIDPTCFILTPKEPLKNGVCYKVTLEAGLCAQSGAFLKEDQSLFLQVDEKPVILSTYPCQEDKWIGLYPKITVSSKEPMVGAIAKINGTAIKGQLVNDKQAYFLLDDLLQPLTTYHLQIQIQAQSGERSEVKEITFTTTSVNEQRQWLVIHSGKQKCLQVYQGMQKIKTIPCAIGKAITEKDYGTYYLQYKAEVYENATMQEGANYWLPFQEKMGIHGYLRSSEWALKEAFLDRLGGTIPGSHIMLADSDAHWLYEQLTPQTMIILCH